MSHGVHAVQHEVEHQIKHEEGHKGGGGHGGGHDSQNKRIALVISVLYRLIAIPMRVSESALAPRSIFCFMSDMALGLENF